MPNRLPRSMILKLRTSSVYTWLIDAVEPL